MSYPSQDSHRFTLIGFFQLVQILENIPLELCPVQTEDCGRGTERHLFPADFYLTLNHTPSSSPLISSGSSSVGVVHRLIPIRISTGVCSVTSTRLDQPIGTQISRNRQSLRSRFNRIFLSAFIIQAVDMKHGVNCMIFQNYLPFRI